MAPVVCLLVLASRPSTLHDVPVDGCALDMRGRDHLLIAKRWRVVTTHPAVAEGIVSTVVLESMSTRKTST